jgi:hypothetical protein
MAVGFSTTCAVTAQVTSEKMLNSYEIFYERTRKM